eukprot:3940288-Rhodomonas_salina.4
MIRRSHGASRAPYKAATAASFQSGYSLFTSVCCVSAFFGNVTSRFTVSYRISGCPTVSLALAPPVQHSDVISSTAYISLRVTRVLKARRKGLRPGHEELRPQSGLGTAILCSEKLSRVKRLYFLR